jgi:hypothetical protein
MLALILKEMWSGGMAEWLICGTSNPKIADCMCSIHVRGKPYFFSKKLYIQCLVLVGSRNGLESDLISFQHKLNKFV